MTRVLIRDHRPERYVPRETAWGDALHYYDKGHDHTPRSRPLFDKGVPAELAQWEAWLRGGNKRGKRPPRIERRTLSWHTLDNGLKRAVVCEWAARDTWMQASDIVHRWHVDSVSLYGCWRALSSKGVVHPSKRDDWQAYRAFVMCGRAD